MLFGIAVLFEDGGWYNPKIVRIQCGLVENNKKIRSYFKMPYFKPVFSCFFGCVSCFYLNLKKLSHVGTYYSVNASINNRTVNVKTPL